MTVRIEVINDGTGIVEQTVRADSYSLFWEQDGHIRHTGTVGLELLARLVAPVVGNFMPWGRKK
ncbi:MAG: hypothetical protein NTZ05_01880 [Chloroflexi bacterium]|nr:hypothetical protein [Chloroflexota bacterium]